MKKIVSPWDFTQPEYDQRSSCFINAGSHHGVGKPQPVGTKKHSDSGPVPLTDKKGMEVDEVPRKNLKIEVDQ